MVCIAEERGFILGLQQGKHSCFWDGCTPLFVAATTLCLDVSKVLIANGADLEAKAPDGRTALMEVIDNVEPEAVEFLIAHGADVKAATPSGDTPLHFAAMRGTQDVAKFLMKLGANPYARNNQDLVPYEVATREDVRPYFAVCPVCLP